MCAGLDVLLLCERLVLDGNPLVSLVSVARLHRLRSLSVNGCGLTDPLLFLPLAKCSSIVEVFARQNLDENGVSQIKIMFQMFAKGSCLFFQNFS